MKAPGTIMRMKVKALSGLISTIHVCDGKMWPKIFDVELILHIKSTRKIIAQSERSSE